jgi:hypothetical protein
MYTKQEASMLREAFWKTFGKYMQPVPSADGQPRNWINYKTGNKHIRIQMDATDSMASICLGIHHKEVSFREDLKQRFHLLQEELDAFPGEWQWQSTEENERYCSVLGSINVYRKEDWPLIISFLKPAIIALDQFWADNKEIFQ